MRKKTVFSRHQMLPNLNNLSDPSLIAKTKRTPGNTLEHPSSKLLKAEAGIHGPLFFGLQVKKNAKSGIFFGKRSILKLRRRCNVKYP